MLLDLKGRLAHRFVEFGLRPPVLHHVAQQIGLVAKLARRERLGQRHPSRVTVGQQLLPARVHGADQPRRHQPRIGRPRPRQEGDRHPLLRTRPHQIAGQRYPVGGDHHLLQTMQRPLVEGVPPQRHPHPLRPLAHKCPWMLHEQLAVPSRHHSILLPFPGFPVGTRPLGASPTSSPVGSRSKRQVRRTARASKTITATTDRLGSETHVNRHGGPGRATDGPGRHRWNMSVRRPPIRIGAQAKKTRLGTPQARERRAGDAPRRA